MFGSSINCVFSLIILLIFTSTSVFSDCYGQQTCHNSYNTWCCSSDTTCGSSYSVCDTDSNSSPAIIAIIIVFVVFFFIMCLTCCTNKQRRQQRLQTAYVNYNTRVATHPYQQQTRGGSVRVVRVRPIYNVEAAPPSHSYPNIYEAPPPSYEVATANLPSIHQSSLPPTVTTTGQQSV